jgi:hypothetical protein
METNGRELSIDSITVRPFSSVKEEIGKESSSGCAVCADWAGAEEIAKKRKRDNPTTIILFSFMLIVFCPLQSVFGKGKLN